MAGDVAIRVEGLGKRYVIGHQAERERYTALRDVIARNARNFARGLGDLVRGRALTGGDSVEDFWALRDLEFEIRRGEVVGVIGRNGAGKSTLLKILSRITEPSEGRVEIHGRVASLLEVGTGFHPELTGRENIFLNGAILGMSRAEIRRKFDEIVAFAEIERFLDTPVKRYSSGMYVRLAFAVAAHLEPEILVVDEVLAVGDAEFQKKCLGKMSEVAGHGRTVLFVSHQLGLVSRLCASAILLEAGRVKAQGPTDAVIGAYNISTVTEDALLRFKPPSEPRPLQPTWAAAYTSTGAPARVFRSSEPINLALGYRGEKFGSARLGMVISRSDGQVVLTTHSSDDASSLPLKTGEGALACTLPANLLAPGVYLISYAADIPMQEVLFREDNAYSFTVTDEGAVGGEVIDGRAGLIRLGLRWSAPDYAPSA